MKALKFTILLLFISFQLMAQVSVNLKVAGAAALPAQSQEFKDNWKTGFGGGAGLSVNLLSTLAVEAEVEYFSFALNTDNAPAGFTVSGRGFSTLNVVGNIKYYILPSSLPLSIYVLGGIGLASSKVEETKETYNGVSFTFPSESKSGVAGQVGAGVQISLGKVCIFAESKYVSLIYNDSSPTQFIPIKAGLIFGL